MTALMFLAPQKQTTETDNLLGYLRLSVKSIHNFCGWYHFAQS